MFLKINKYPNFITTQNTKSAWTATLDVDRIFPILTSFLFFFSFNDRTYL